MVATRLCREDAGKLIDAMKDLSNFIENLGIEEGSVVITKENNIYGNFIIDTNSFDIKVLDDGKTETISYEK